MKSVSLERPDVFLRQSFVEWAVKPSPECARAKAYYQQQNRSGKRHQTILRSLAFKWLRILWRCWQDLLPYDESRYLQSLIQRKSPLAARLAAA